MVVGALNWGVWALTGWDVSQLLGGMDTTASKVLFVLVGLSALYEVTMHKKDCKSCVSK